MILFEQYLVENRIEFLKQQHAKGIDTSHDEYAIHTRPGDIIDHFAQHADPSVNKQYTHWIVNQYKNKSIRQEDADRIKRALSTLDAHKHRLDKKDINSYDSITDLERTVAPFVDRPATNREIALKEVEDGLKILHKDNKIQINHLQTPEVSMRLYGGGAEGGKRLGTNWCTAANPHTFNDYTSKGKLYTIHIQGDPKSPYQFHTSGQFMDRFDDPVGVELAVKYPKIGEVLGSVHPLLDSEGKFLEQHLQNPRDVVRIAAVRHPKVSGEHLDRALNDSDERIRRAAIQNPNATREHIDKALSDKNILVRRAAIEHPNATVEHIDRALDDHSDMVRIVAFRHPKVTTEHIDRALDDRDDGIRAAAIENPNATYEHIDRALGDRSFYVRLAAIRHPKTTAEHIEKALRDKDIDIRTTAQKILDARSR